MESCLAWAMSALYIVSLCEHYSFALRVDKGEIARMYCTLPATAPNKPASCTTAVRGLSCLCYAGIASPGTRADKIVVSNATHQPQIHQPHTSHDPPRIISLDHPEVVICERRCTYTHSISFYVVTVHGRCIEA